ncbi:Telomerase Cajal body protein 1 [Entophlyctis luteolus]|nr:Telomerase Cajal body protein 1 [Entophlyctis luteolus]
MNPTLPLQAFELPNPLRLMARLNFSMGAVSLTTLLFMQHLNVLVVPSLQPQMWIRLACVLDAVGFFVFYLGNYLNDSVAGHGDCRFYLGFHIVANLLWGLREAFRIGHVVMQALLVHRSRRRWPAYWSLVFSVVLQVVFAAIEYDLTGEVRLRSSAFITFRVQRFDMSWNAVRSERAKEETAGGEHAIRKMEAVAEGAAGQLWAICALLACHAVWGAYAFIKGGTKEITFVATQHTVRVMLQMMILLASTPDEGEEDAQDFGCLAMTDCLRLCASTRTRFHTVASLDMDSDGYTCAHAPVGAEFFFASCAWSPDGACLLAADSSRMLRVFNASPLYSPDVAEAVHVRASEPVYATAWFPRMSSADPESCLFAAALRDHPIQLFDAYDGSVRAAYSGVFSIVLLSRIPYPTNAPTAFTKGDLTTAPHSVAFSPDGTRILAGLDSAIHVFDTAVQGGAAPATVVRTKGTSNAGRRGGQPQQRGIISHLATTPTHPSLVLAASYARSWAVHDLRDGGAASCCWIAAGLPGAGVTQAAFGTRDPNLVLCASRVHDAVLAFDLRYMDGDRNSDDEAQPAGRPPKPLFSMRRSSKPNSRGQFGTNQRLFFSLSPDGALLSSGDETGNLHIFDLTNSGQLLTSTKISNEAVGAASFNPYYFPSQVKSTTVDNDNQGHNMNYFIATCSGERRSPRVSDTDLQVSDSDSEREEGEHVKGSQAEINVFQFSTANT